MKKLSILILLLVACTLLGCAPSEEELEREAEKVAQAFSVIWQQEDYGEVYDYFIPDLQTLRSKQLFVKFVEESQELYNFNLIYDKTVLQNRTLAYAYYTFSGELIFQPKSPALEIKYVDGGWRLNTLAKYFEEDCVSETCEDFDKCTEDLCDENTGFVCKYKNVEGCCNVDKDCLSDKPYCHDNACYTEMCLSDIDCYYPKPICNKGNCVECTQDYDCTSDYVCDLEKDECVPEILELCVGDSADLVVDKRYCTLSVVGANVDENQAILKVDDTVRFVNTDNTYLIGGLYIDIKNIFYDNLSKDICVALLVR